MIDRRPMTWNKKKKKRQVTYIAPLQPPTLATFLSWGSSVGAGRIRLAGCKCTPFGITNKYYSGKFEFFSKKVNKNVVTSDQLCNL